MGYTEYMKTLFFDWGGVVADDPGDDFLAKLLADIGASPAQIQEILQRYMKQFMRGEITEQEYWEALRAGYGFTIDESIAGEFEKWTGLQANEAVLALVDEARARGWKTAILSNVIEPTYNVLQNAGFYDRFDITVLSCKEGVAKPEREIYEIALHKAGATAEESVFIDDKQQNLDPADAMGFRTLLAKSPEQIIRDIKSLL